MVKSVSLVLAGFLLLIPGFFTDFLGLLLLLPPVQKSLTLKLMPHLSVYRPGGWTGGDAANGNTFDGEFQRRTTNARCWNTARTRSASPTIVKQTRLRPRFSSLQHPHDQKCEIFSLAP